MLKIDDNLLQEIGLGTLPPEEKRGLLSHIYETLEMRVGMRLADQMTNEQLDEFEQYFEAKDDAGAFKWLESNFPNYKDIVNEEFEKLKNEVASTATQILTASQQNLAAHPLQPQIPPQPAPQYQQPPVQQQPQPQPTYQQPVAPPTPQQWQQPQPASSPEPGFQATAAPQGQNQPQQQPQFMQQPPVAASQPYGPPAPAQPAQNQPYQQPVPQQPFISPQPQSQPPQTPPQPPFPPQQQPPAGPGPQPR